MKNIGTFLFALLAMAMLIPAASYADGDFNDVVYDMRDNLVHDARGNCVITKWLVGEDKCSPGDPVMARHSFTRPYLVFFDWDKSDITPEAGGVLSKLYGDARKAVRAWYHITGHADRSGPDAYNMKLSKRRADAVKAQLMRLGVPEDAISIDFKGEREPLVQTADGVREPQNRRAEVRLTVEKNKREPQRPRKRR